MLDLFWELGRGMMTLVPPTGTIFGAEEDYLEYSFWLILESRAEESSGLSLEYFSIDEI